MSDTETGVKSLENEFSQLKTDPSKEDENAQEDEATAPKASKIKIEEEDSDTSESPTLDKENDSRASNVVEKDAPKELKPSASTETDKPTKKRGRGRPPKSETDAPTSNKKLKVEQEVKKPAAVTKEKKPRAAKKSGSARESFSTAHDAYIRHLWTNAECSKLSLAQKHESFENRFSTGKSVNCLRFRWRHLKEENLVLSNEEEAALKKAIQTFSSASKKAEAILNEYKNTGNGFTKLTQGYVLKRMKEFENENGGGGGDREPDTAEDE
ncbi:hypothetical protein H072_6179 [Dactylellina haptotyla CBS 200.50]|uniref:Myb-like domain-containing protein n=1 Tax=Dactylellina haptotyla (strain CBS 200.50) TaxID=1284197 RepID=S8AFX3_DACHA|nr:hypothetical protein H072_6179 [Dactylellina haptotyla CBS 200.50]